MPPKPPRRIRLVGRVLKRGAPPKTVLVGYTPNRLPPNVIVQKALSPDMADIFKKVMDLGGIVIKWKGYTIDEVVNGPFIYYERGDDGKLYLQRTPSRSSLPTVNLQHK